jgi:hypothetical protein
MPADTPLVLRRAYLLAPNFAVSGERVTKVFRAAIGHVEPTAKVMGNAAAITKARELSADKLGPPPAGRDSWNHLEGGFGVRTAIAADAGFPVPEIRFLVEGPPAPDGALPDWHMVRGRKRVEREPGCFELVVPEAEAADAR